MIMRPQRCLAVILQGLLYKTADLNSFFPTSVYEMFCSLIAQVCMAISDTQMCINFPTVLKACRRVTGYCQDK